MLPKTKFVVCLCELSSGIQWKLRVDDKTNGKISKFKTYMNIAPFGSGKVLVPWMEIENFFLIVHLLVVHHRKCTNFHVIFGRLLLLFFFVVVCSPVMTTNEKKVADVWVFHYVCVWANTEYKNAGVVVCHNVFFLCFSTSSSIISLGCRTNTHYFLVFLFP